jgi:hypothetical protein
MSILVHCDHCGKRIEAPDNAGGKWGKCPACGGRVYVPSPDLDDEELKLAPLDQDEEARVQEMLAETAALRQDILKEREVPPEQVQAEQGGGDANRPTTLNDKDLKDAIITYLRMMADGELEEAEQSAAYIIPCGARAKATLEKVALSEIPEPRLDGIPPQVLSGLIKNLRAKIH